MAADSRRGRLGAMNKGTKLSGVPQKLARISMGRVALHLVCAMRDGQVQWHWEGIKRELPLTKADWDRE